MDALLIWNLSCWLGCAAAVYLRTETASPLEMKGRNLPKWMADMTAYPEPLEGYSDPLFETAPMELERAAKR